MKCNHEVVYEISTVLKVCPVCMEGFRVSVIYPDRDMPFLSRDCTCPKCKSKLRITDKRRSSNYGEYIFL